MESRFKINVESISLRFPVPISEYLSLGAATVLSCRPIFYYAQLLNKMVAQPNSDTQKLLGKWLIPWRFLVIVQEQFFIRFSNIAFRIFNEELATMSL